MLTGPLQLMAETARLTLAAQQVVAMRLMVMLGGWSVTATENSRMVAEKPPAFLNAWSAASIAAMQGKSPDAVMRAYLRPLSSKAFANRRRLARRGPAVF